MTFLYSIILGITEGFTEFLPVSSTGHLILASRLLSIPADDFLKSFEIAIQLGAILSVAVLYGKILFGSRKTAGKIIAAFIPTGIIGFFLYKFVRSSLLGNTAVVSWSLLIGGIFLIIFEWRHREKEAAVSEIGNISYQQAIGIGLAQSVAIIPGISRAAATILGGLWLGLKRKTIVEFSFLLAFPTMLAATALDIYKNASLFSTEQFGFLAIGFLVSFAVAILSIKTLLAFIKNHNFISFGIYRILAAIVFWLIIK